MILLSFYLLTFFLSTAFYLVDYPQPVGCGFKKLERNEWDDAALVIRIVVVDIAIVVHVDEVSGVVLVSRAQPPIVSGDHDT